MKKLLIAVALCALSGAALAQNNTGTTKGATQAAPMPPPATRPQTAPKPAVASPVIAPTVKKTTRHKAGKAVNRQKRWKHATAATSKRTPAAVPATTPIAPASK